MRTQLIAIAAVALLGTAVVTAPAEEPPATNEKAAAGIDWMTDLGAARGKARGTGRPLLVVFC